MDEERTKQEHKHRRKKQPKKSGAVSLWPPALILAGLLIFFFSKRFDIEHFPPRLSGTTPETALVKSPQTDDPEPRTLFTPVSRSVPTPDPTLPQTAIPETLQTIRVAVWNLYPLTFAKITDGDIGGRIAEMIAGYDLTAVLGFRAKNRSLADALLYRINQPGRNFACVVSGRISPEGEFQAFYYNRNRIVADESRLYDLTDPAHRLPSAGFAGAFAAKNVPPEKRFTFLFCGVRLESNTSESNRDVLADIYRTLSDRGEDEGNPEDDLLLGGSFEAPIHQLGALARIPNLAAVSDSLTTTVDGRTVDHLIFNERAVTEYVERFGAGDPAERLGISREEADRIGGHFPVYADFSVLESE